MEASNASARRTLSQIHIMEFVSFMREKATYCQKILRPVGAPPKPPSPMNPPLAVNPLQFLPPKWPLRWGVKLYSLTDSPSLLAKGWHNPTVSVSTFATGDCHLGYAVTLVISPTMHSCVLIVWSLFCTTLIYTLCSVFCTSIQPLAAIWNRTIPHTSKTFVNAVVCSARWDTR